MELGLRDKAVLIGGASRGIGLAVARTFLAEGAHVAIAARGAEALEAARAELADEHPDRTVLAFAGDMSDPAHVERVVAAAVAELGHLDCAVASAGSGRGPSGWRVEPGDWQAILDENLMTAVLFSQRAAAELGPGGALVLIGSIAGLGDLGSPLPYQAAKAALVRYTRDLARRLAPEGIRANLVAPGNVRFLGGRWEELLAEDRERVEQYIATEVPMTRFGTPEEVAELVVFLASERASFVTGACLVADGGQLR